MNKIIHLLIDDIIQFHNGFRSIFRYEIGNPLFKLIGIGG